jgi:hypothetical protein
VLDHDATVHDDVDASGFGAGCGFEVDDSLLDPEVREAELEHLVDDGGDEFGKAKDVDDVWLDGEIGEAGVAFFAEDLGDRGVDGVDLVAPALHVFRDVVAWLGWDFREADDGDSAWVIFGWGDEHVADEFGFVHFFPERKFLRFEVQGR